MRDFIYLGKYILLSIIIVLLGWFLIFNFYKEQRIIEIKRNQPIYYIKHSNQEVEKTCKDVEKYFFAVPWKGKFGTAWYDYYQGVVSNIAEIIQYNGYKKDEFGAKISLLVDGNGEYFIFLQIKLYKTGYKGQFYTEWYVSEHGGKAPDVKLPDVPFVKPRKPEPKDDFKNFNLKPKGETVFL